VIEVGVGAAPAVPNEKTRIPPTAQAKVIKAVTIRLIADLLAPVGRAPPV
jgi:hypothetical protein